MACNGPPETASCEDTLEALYYEASEAPRSTLAAQRAVESLAQCPGSPAREMLTNIALAKTPFSDEHIRASAIGALADRREQDADVVISEAISPSASVVTRRAVAVALLQTGCGNPCVANLISYFERLYEGELLAEEKTFAAARLQGIPEDIIEVGAKPVRAAQKEVNDILSEVMTKAGSSVTEVLATVYGLGTGAPKPFALKLLGELRLTEACPDLLRSRDAVTSVGSDTASELGRLTDELCPAGKDQ